MHGLQGKRALIIGGTTGIGLAVVKTLVEQMGGSVAVEEAEGGGAVFMLVLRTCAAPAAAAQVPDR